MKILIILNEPPYGTERNYNALQLAHRFLRNGSEIDLTLFLMADAVLCAKRGQKTSAGYYNTESMMKPIIRGGSLTMWHLHGCPRAYRG